MMKLLIFLTLIISVSCVSPRDKRALYSGAENSTETESTNTQSSSDSSSNENESGDDSTVTVVDGSDSGNSVNVPTEISACSWSADGSTGFENTAANMDSKEHAHLGDNTVCQSRTDKNNIYLQLKTPITDVRVCMVPTYEQNGRSIYLGEARCQFISSNKEIFKFPLLKNRDYGRYQNFSINGVMVLKEQTYFFDSPFYREQISYDAYFICSVNMDLYGDSSYCETFKNKGEYFYKKF